MVFRGCFAVCVLGLLSAAGCDRPPEQTETLVPHENVMLESHVAPECYRFDARMDEARIAAGQDADDSAFRRGFDFLADASPWTISEGTAHCGIADNALAIESESAACCDSPTMATVPASRVATILIDARVSGCSEFALAWRGETGGFLEENKVAIDAVPSEHWTRYKIDTATLDGWGREFENVGQLRLVLPGSAKMWVRSVVLASQDADVRFAGKRYGLTDYPDQGNMVQSLFIRTPGALEYDVSVMLNARLTAEFRLLGSRAGQFRVLVMDGPDQTIVAGKQGLKANSSQTIAVDLSQWAGKRVRIRFEAESQQPGAIALWSNPVLARVYPVTEAARPMNVIWYVIDALRASSVSAYGYSRETSPAIDAVAKEGVRFDWCFSPGSWTMASVPSFFTGLSPNAHGVPYSHPQVPASMRLLPEILRDSGYATALFTQNPYLTANRGFARGFDELQEFRIRDPRAMRKGDTADVYPINVAIEKYVGKHKEDPMFLYIHTLEPHHPYMPPGRLRVFTHPDGSRTATDLYDGCVLWADENLAHLIGVLKKNGLWNNTLLIISADHGECLPELDDGRHGHGLEPYLTRMRIPLVMRLPGFIPDGVVIEENVQALDIPRTLFDLLQIEPDPQFEGMSLMGLLDGTRKSEFAQRSVFPSGEESKWQAVVRDRWFFLDNDGKGELIDLRTNPSQSANVIQDHPDIAQELLAETVKYREAELAKASQYETESPDSLVVDPENQKELEALGYLK